MCSQKTFEARWYTQWGKLTNNRLEQYNQAGLTPVAYQSFLFQHQPGLEENYFNQADMLLEAEKCFTAIKDEHPINASQLAQRKAFSL